MEDHIAQNGNIIKIRRKAEVEKRETEEGNKEEQMYLI
jgi:hypothetical protein